ncbi:MAG: hypothetical protein J7496_01110 [Novosphingobium sp.]|nr:hypothetical protein [Novosphingobium sp.]
MGKAISNSSPFPFLAADVQEHLGLIVLRDVAYDAASGKLTAKRLEAEGAHAEILLDIHPDDRAKLAGAAGQDRVKTELRMAGGQQGNAGLVLQGCRGGTAWAHGAMIDLPSPSFALEKLATRSRLAELGKQCAAVAHEIRQPLSTIAMASESLRLLMTQHGGLPEQALAALEHIQEEVERARTIVDQTLDYAAGRSASPGRSARPDETAAPAADLGRAADHAVRLLTYQIDKAEIDLRERSLSGPLAVAMPQIELEQILLNILRNSIESIDARRQAGWTGKGKIGLAVDADERQLRLTVSDNGTGPGWSQPASGFQPFVTTKGEDGNGLGLYVCEQLLAKAGGHLSLHPGEGEGARVEIVVPRRDACGPADPQASSRSNRKLN